MCVCMYVSYICSVTLCAYVRCVRMYVAFLSVFMYVYMYIKYVRMLGMYVSQVIRMRVMLCMYVCDVIYLYMRALLCVYVTCVSAVCM